MDVSSTRKRVAHLSTRSLRWESSRRGRSGKGGTGWGRAQLTKWVVMVPNMPRSRGWGTRSHNYRSITIMDCEGDVKILNFWRFSYLHRNFSSFLPPELRSTGGRWRRAVTGAEASGDVDLASWLASQFIYWCCFGCHSQRHQRIIRQRQQ